MPRHPVCRVALALLACLATLSALPPTLASPPEHASLTAFLCAHREELQPLRDAIDRGEPIAPTKAQRSMLDELDRLSRQRDSLWSGLTWHTDLGEAIAEAGATGKPILSLRLLGRLDESFSCANSRFFRAALYSNAEISDYLREHFVLHWHSVRDAPVMTVEFGDGRTLRQTITGNSVHYILTPSGEVVDALPGLYTPRAFLNGLRHAETRAKTGQVATNALAARLVATDESPRPTDARAAGELTTTKIALERIPLRAFVPSSTPAAVAPVISPASDNSTLDARSRSLLLSQMGRNPGDPEAESALQRFQSLMEQDTALNALRTRPAILELLADASLRADPVALDVRVYDEVFLSPLSDPWVGLADPSILPGIWQAERTGATR